MTTVRDLLQEGKCRLADFAVARLEAEILLGTAMAVSRAHLFAHPDQIVPSETAESFLDLVERRRNGEPVAYLTGSREFWSLSIEVSPAVLIPRPETEVLVQAALDRIPNDAPWRIADLGTGSGAIAIALAHERPECEIHASDISTAALEIARKNAERLVPGKIRFHAGSWLEPLEGRFDMIVSNPPYVAGDDAHLGEGDLRFEPASALASGPDGLDAIRAITRAAPGYLQPGGWLGFEHGYQQADDCRSIMESARFKSIETLKDLEGTKRVTIGKLE